MLRVIAGRWPLWVAALGGRGGGAAGASGGGGAGGGAALEWARTAGAGGSGDRRAVHPALPRHGAAAPFALLVALLGRLPPRDELGVVPSVDSEDRRSVLAFMRGLPKE